MRDTRAHAWRPRVATGGLASHVLHRRVGRVPLFDTPADDAACEPILEPQGARPPTRVAAYCLMPHHWHLRLWPRHDGEVSEILRGVTGTHTQRWHAPHQTAGTGPLYQGRFKAFLVQTDEQFLTVARSVERTALRAKLGARAEEWRRASLWRREQGDPTRTALLSPWPVDRTRDWVAWVNEPERGSEVEALRQSVNRGRPFGREPWVQRVSKRLGVQSTLRPRGRPRRDARRS